MKKSTIILMIAVVLALAGGLYYWYRSAQEGTIYQPAPTYDQSQDLQQSTSTGGSFTTSGNSALPDSAPPPTPTFVPNPGASSTSTP